MNPLCAVPTSVFKDTVKSATSLGEDTTNGYTRVVALHYADNIATGTGTGKRTETDSAYSQL